MGRSKKKILRYLFVIISLVLSLTPVYAGSRTISWENLLSGEEVRFDDPFIKLTSEQLRDLKMVARIRRMIENHKCSPDGINAQEEKRLTARLTQQGIDVDWLISQRERVADMRRKRIEGGGEGVVGSHIRIPGYMLPLQSGQKGVTSFLLVPWVAPCSHFPPPPPNQVIHVSTPGGIASRGRFDAIWVEGNLQRRPAAYKTFLMDGTRPVETIYALTSDLVTDYSAKDSDVLDRVGTQASGQEQSWYKNIQIRTAILLTRAMTAIRDRESSVPVWIGLLIAFTYGVLHTLGPGHGKAVVVSYFVGHGGSIGRGVRTGAQIAICHVLSAVVIVWLTNFIIRQATGHAPSDFRLVRLVSYGAITVIGGVMLWKALRDVLGKHANDHEYLPCSEQGHTDHDHYGCCACNALTHHAGPVGWLALAVGAVPCTGAILVLLFGLSHDLLWPAILMVIAISAGMALSMSGIGILAIFGRHYADRKLSQSDSARVRFNRAVRVGAAALIVIIGLSLFVLTMTDDGLTIASGAAFSSVPA